MKARIHALMLGSTLLVTAQLTHAQPKPTAPSETPKEAPKETPAPTPKPAEPAEAVLPPVPTTPPDAAALKKAKGLFDSATKEYEAGQFENAIQLLNQAYRVAPRDGIVFSLAQTHRRQFIATTNPAHLKKAIALYELYMVRVPNGGRREEATSALESLRLFSRGTSTDSSQVSPEPIEKARTRIYVNLVASGTLVSIDGKTPAPPGTFDVSPGKHTVKLVAPGYYDEEATVTLAEGEGTSGNLPQREKPGKLVVNADDGSDIFVDGRFIDEAPITALEVPPGRHYITASKNGHVTLDEEILVKRAEVAKVDFSLETTSQRDVSYVFLIGGGAIAAAGAVLGGIALSREADAVAIAERQESGTVNITDDELADYDNARSDRELYLGLGIGGLAGGALIGLVGAGLFLFDKPLPVSQAKPRDEAETPEGPVKDKALDMSFVPVVSPETVGLTSRIVF